MKKDQLKVLDKTRLDLNLILDERNQVLDLLAEHVRPGGQVHKVNRKEPYCLARQIRICVFSKRIVKIIISP